MTDRNDRIEAALAALDYLPTPKKLEERTEWALGIVGKYFRADASEVEVDEALQISMILTFFIRKIYKDNTRLRKWKDDAYCHVEISRNYLSTELKTTKDDGSGVIDQLKQLKEEADRLIAEAEGEKHE